MQIKLATTRNNNEQQQDAPSNAKSYVYTKWTVTTLTFEETIRQGRNRSTKA
jgi:hypothetical protein